jgi:hypothetical protein
MASQTKQTKQKKSVRFVTEFRHWRSGKLIRACDYGKKAFVFYN